MAEKYQQKQDYIKSEISEFMKMELVNEMSHMDDLSHKISKSPYRIK